MREANFAVKLCAGILVLIKLVYVHLKIIKSMNIPIRIFYFKTRIYAVVSKIFKYLSFRYQRKQPSPLAITLLFVASKLMRVLENFINLGGLLLTF